MMMISLYKHTYESPTMHVGTRPCSVCRPWSLPGALATVTRVPMWGTRARVSSPDINQHVDSLPTELLVLRAWDESSSLDQPETPIPSHHNGATELCSLRRHQEGPARAPGLPRRVRALGKMPQIAGESKGLEQKACACALSCLITSDSFHPRGL